METLCCARRRLPYYPATFFGSTRRWPCPRIFRRARPQNGFFHAIAMLVHVLKSKLHRAAVTAASVDYEGSLTISEDLIERAGFVPYERILCSNMANGARWETYVIKGPRGTGAIELNGAVAHLGKPGDKVTIMAFTEIEQHRAAAWSPTVVVLGEGNRIASRRGI